MSRDLTTFRNHCRRRARADTDPDDVALWTRLADEVDRYLADPPDPLDELRARLTDPLDEELPLT